MAGVGDSGGEGAGWGSSGGGWRAGAGAAGGLFAGSVGGSRRADARHALAQRGAPAVDAGRGDDFLGGAGGGDAGEGGAAGVCVCADDFSFAGDRGAAGATEAVAVAFSSDAAAGGGGVRDSGGAGGRADCVGVGGMAFGDAVVGDHFGRAADCDGAYAGIAGDSGAVFISGELVVVAGAATVDRVSGAGDSGGMVGRMGGDGDALAIDHRHGGESFFEPRGRAADEFAGGAHCGHDGGGKSGSDASVQGAAGIFPLNGVGDVLAVEHFAGAGGIFYVAAIAGKGAGGD